MARTRTIPRVIVQAGRTLSDNLSDWTTLEWLEFDAYDEGADQVIGWATFHAGYGRRTPHGTPTPQVVGLPQVLGVPAPEWLGGRLIRVLSESVGGDVVIDGVEYDLAWVGPIEEVIVLPDSSDEPTSGGLVQVTAVGVGAMLDQCTVRTGFVAGGGLESAGGINPGFCPPFNALPGGDHTVILGSDAHELVSSADYWTARQVLDYVLVDMGGSIAWAISDPDDCLSYQVETLDVHGWTIFQVLVFLTTRRGLTFHLRPLGDFVTILIRSTSPTAISIDTFTLPASTVTATFDLRGDVWYSDPQLTYDSSSVYDVIEVEGARPLIGLTPSDAWSEGWTAPTELAWDENPLASGTEDVHRRLLLKPSWDGANLGETNGLRTVLVTEESAAYGDGGYTGERTWESGDDPFPASSLSIEGFIPWSVSFGAELAGDRPAPIVVVPSGDETAPYIDATQTFGWGVQILEQPAALRLFDDANGGSMSNYIDLDEAVQPLVTIGIREAAPLRVSWRRHPDYWPRPSPRVKTVNVPGFEQWIVLAGTVTGVNDDGSLRTLSTQRTVRNDLPNMRALLVLLRAQYEEPSVRMSLVDRGIIDTSATYRPATLITAVHTGSTTLTPNGVISRRGVRRVTRRGVSSYDTHYLTEQKSFDIQAVL
jgi:hypothetical protein